MLTLPDVPPRFPVATDEQVARLRQKYPNLPATLARCITCRGKKTFRWYAYENGVRTPEVVDWECNCPAQFLAHRAFLAAGIGHNYQTLDANDIIGVPLDALDASLVDYFDNFDAYRHAGISLVLTGDRGTGKTLVSSLLTKRFVTAGVRAYQTTFVEMVDTFSGGWKDKDERDWFSKNIRNAEVLTVDDIGRENKREVFQSREQREATGTGGLIRKTHSMIGTMFEDVVRHRVSGNMPLIVSTNLTEAEIEQGYGEHAMSLLSERALMVTFTGVDYRPNVRTRILDEVRAGITRPVMF